MVYKTKQREQIIELIKEQHSHHINAEILLKEIEKRNLDISRATLYRHLDKMVSEGILKKIIVDDKTPACYQLCDLDDHNHFHLICEKCGKLIHLDCEKIEDLISHINKDHGFEVNPSRVVLYGLCEDCQNNK